MMMISTTGGEISAREKDSNRAYFNKTARILTWQVQDWNADTRSFQCSPGRDPRYPTFFSKGQRWNVTCCHMIRTLGPPDQANAWSAQNQKLTTPGYRWRHTVSIVVCWQHASLRNTTWLVRREGSRAQRLHVSLLQKNIYICPHKRNHD